jgi:hypothetical protein
MPAPRRNVLKPPARRVRRGSRLLRPASNPPASTLVDDFQDSIFDSVKWPAVSGSPTETSGKLVLDPNEIAMSAFYDWRGSSGYIDAAVLPTVGAAYFGIYSDPTVITYFEYLPAAGTLGFLGGTPATVTYNASTMRYWRHRESGGTWFFDTSSDGTNWTNRSTATTFAGVNSARYRLVNDITSTGTYEVGGVNVVAAGPIPTASVGTPVDGVGSHVNSPPAGTIQNNLLLCYCWLDINTSTVATPATWTLLHGPIDSAGTDCRLYVFAKLAGASEGTTTFTDALGGRDWTSVIVGVNGNLTTALGTGAGDGAIDRTATSTPAAGTSAATSSITPTVNNCLIIGAAHADLSATSTPNWTEPSGWTEDLDRQNATSFVNGTIAHFGQATAAAISGTFTSAVSDEIITHIIAVAPAPAGGGQTVAVNQVVETDIAQPITAIGGNPFPSTIGGIHAESNNRLGPFIDGNGNLYTITELSVADPRPCMRKSTDGGRTWAEVNAANRPAHDDLESLWIEQRGTVLYVLHQRSGTMRVSHNTFNTSDAGANPDTWQVKDEVVHLPGTAPANQAVSLAVRTNGDLLAFYRTDPVSSFQRLAWRKKPSGGAWGAETQVDTTASTNFTQVAVVVGASDKVHIFYKNDTTSAVWHKSLTSADSLSASSVVNDNATTTDDQMMATPPVYVDVGGTERVYAAWKRTSNGFLVGAPIDNDGTPSAEESISDVAVWEDPAAVISEQVVATLAVDSVSGKMYALYADNATHDLWKVVRNGTWSANTEVLDAVEVQYLSATVFTHGTQGQSKRVLGIIFDDNPTGATDAGVPKYTQVLLGQLAVVGQVTETDTSQPITKKKTKVLGQVTETSTAQILTRQRLRTVNQATETSTAQAIVKRKLRTTGQSVETDIAQQISESKVVAQITETDTAQAITRRKTKILGQVTETNISQSIVRFIQGVVVLSAPIPYNMAAPLGIITLGQVAETDTAQPVIRIKTRALGQVVETSTAQAVARLKIRVVQQGTDTQIAQTIISGVRTGTQLHLTTIAAESGVTAGAGTRHRFHWDAGTSSTIRNKNTVAGPTAPLQVTDSSTPGTDGAVVSWYSNQLEAVTIAGAITIQLWAEESGG